MTPLVESPQLGIRRPPLTNCRIILGPIIKMCTIHARLVIYVWGINHQNLALSPCAREGDCQRVIDIDNAWRWWKGDGLRGAVAACSRIVEINEDGSRPAGVSLVFQRRDNEMRTRREEWLLPAGNPYINVPFVRLRWHEEQIVPLKGRLWCVFTAKDDADVGV